MKTEILPGGIEKDNSGKTREKLVMRKRRNKRLLAGILAILLGAFGVHKFVLGYIKEGIVQLVFTMITFGFGGLISLVEGILYLAMSDEEFYRTYQEDKRSWF
ncbi:TM2 domain-containing protein [Sinomicrobium sp. M5D2P17]